MPGQPRPPSTPGGPGLALLAGPMDNPTNDQPPVRPVVDVLYIEGCPNYPGAVALVQRVSAELGIDAQVRLQQISDPEVAIRARFVGSPTIRVDGRDIQPGAERQQDYVHACWLYQGRHSLRGLPEEDWLRQALRTAEARQ